MYFDGIYNEKLRYIIGLSSTGSYARAILTGSVVDLKLTLPDGHAINQYRGLLKISDDDQQVHTIQWIKKSSADGEWYPTNSWVKIQ